MFGKLSLWAANTYHGPAIPKLDIQRGMPDAQATQAAAGSPDVVHHTPAACMFDPQGFNPASFHHWTAEEKAEFMYENRNSPAITQLTLSYQLSKIPMYNKFSEVLATCDISDIIKLLDDPVSSEKANDMVNFACSGIWGSLIIPMYMSENQGIARNNLISWIASATNYLWDEESQPKESNLIGIHTRLPNNTVTYVIQNNIPPKLKFSISNFAQCHAALNQIAQCSRLKIFMHIVGLPSEYHQLTEEQYELAHHDSRAKLHVLLAQQIPRGLAFVKFAERYAGGIPPTLHAQWSQYTIPGMHSQGVFDSMLKPWGDQFERIIKILRDTPMMDEIYYMFPP